MPQTTKEKKRNAYARRQRAWEVMKMLAIRHGYTVTGKDVSGVDDFLDALVSGEAITLLLPDADVKKGSADTDQSIDR